MKRVCLYCVLLWAAVACAPGDNKYSERDFVGIWVEPVPGMAGVQGIALEEDGAAHSVTAGVREKNQVISTINNRAHRPMME